MLQHIIFFNQDQFNCMLNIQPYLYILLQDIRKETDANQVNKSNRQA